MPLANITQLEPFNINTSASFSFANITSSGNITASYLIGNGSQLTGLPASYANSDVAAYLPTYSGSLGGTLTSAAQTGITSVGSLADLTVTGLTTATGGVKTANIVDVSGTTTIQTKYSGVSGDVGVVGNLVVGTSGSGNVTATYINGNGAPLTGLNASNIASGTIPSSILGNSTVYVGTSSIALNRSSGSQTLTGISVDGSAATVTGNAQPNITSVGSLVDLSVSGNATITGNLTVGGNTNYINVETLVIEDPVIEQGGGPNGDPLTTNDGKDRGSLLHYYTTTPVDAFMGWDASASEFGFGSNVSVSGEVVTFNNYGNIRGGYFLGNGSLLTGLPASYANSNVAAYLPTYTGEFSVANVTATGNITASYLIGNGSQLTGLPASYANANVATYLPTYTGNLSPGNLFVGTSANLGAVGNIIITGGSSGQVLSTNGSGVLSWADQSGGSSGPSSPVASVQVFTADGTGNTYTLTSTPANEDQITVNIDGVLQLHSSFSLSGNVVTIDGIPTNGAKVEITNIAARPGATTGKAIAMAIVFGF